MKAPLLVGTIALSVLLAGCASQPGSAVQTQTSAADAGQTPSPQETTSVSPSSKASTQPVGKYTLGELQSMPSEQFNELAFEYKAKYIKYLLEDSKKHLIYYTAPGTKLYEHNPLEVFIVTNTPQEIAMQLWYELQVTSAQPLSDNVDDHTLDTEKAKKALSIPFYSTTGPDAASTYGVMKDSIDKDKEAGRLQDRYSDAKELLPLTERIDDNGKAVQVKTISLMDNGVEYILEVALRKLDDETSIWQIYKKLK